MSNPFDDENGRFHVLVNASGEYSLWPDFATEPAGWIRVLGSVSRTEALEHVEAHWTALSRDGLKGARRAARQAERASG
ncbi:MAG: MbtH family protein [Intrasporangium sp.]|uniref:MbtH family protein n=1 Tax=Intrasporangium sp. TaxID=1925024 RepID=UPI002647A90C|nr:MbtH family protein [Intrasporangium sp.]MDN5794432.1 MbtH family protein [Intrasporangium sp.]